MDITDRESLMEPAIFICRNNKDDGIDCAGYIWGVERDERGSPVEGVDAKRCPFCSAPGHRMSTEERIEAGLLPPVGPLKYRGG